jgi:methionyl-tRNA formyltransferase
MGTPEFAVPSLGRLVEDGFNIVGVITAMDKPKGRGQKLAVSPVKAAAIKYGIPVLQPKNLKSEEFLAELKALDANLQVVVAFRMLPEVVWAMPEYGTFNLHASLLPDYRGAAPINWAIMKGEVETGVTTFFIKHDIDTGNIIFQESEPISEDDTAGTLYGRLMEKGANLVLKTVRAIKEESYETTMQGEMDEEKKAPKIFKEDCKIDWKASSREIYNFVRGLSPYPCAWTKLDGNTYKIFKVAVNEQSVELGPGAFISDNKKFLRIGTADSSVNILELQPEGKRRMGIEEFLRGNKF